MTLSRTALEDKTKEEKDLHGKKIAKVCNYEGRLLNKLQNGAVSLVF